MNNNAPRLDRHLWRACAGRTVKIPAEGSIVYYFPQGHAENANCSADFAAVALGLPPMILCRVIAVNLTANSETGEVFAAMKLIPVGNNDPGEYHGGDEDDNPEDLWTGTSFAKVLTQSDANNGGGFSVPRHCADTVFPALNYSADPPVQELSARDVHGEVWKFRHIYRGTPRRHLLTSGWSVFVNRKRLVARDSIVFLRSDCGEICVGTRRARRTALQGRVRAEEFAEAVRRASRGEAFEAVFYPRGGGDGAAEFCVRAAEVRAALADPWRSGLRLKMEVEDETTSRVKNCNGITTAVKAFDPVNWPNSPWRLLQVSWDDEPDKQHNPQCVSPWMIDAVPNMMMCPPFPPDEQPRKKFRPENYQDFIFSGKFSVPPGTILGDSLGPINPSGYQYNTNPVGIQGARHLVLEVPLPEYFSNDQRVRMDLYHSRAAPAPPPEKFSPDPDSVVTGPFCSNGDLSCLLSLQQTSPSSGEWPGGTKNHVVSLFGQVLGVFQIDSSDVEVNEIVRKSSYENSGAEREGSDSVKIGRCKVFKEFADVGWTIDLSVVGSYEELYKSLSNEFKIEISAMMTRVLYHDATGAPKHTGDLPFNEFMKIAKRLTIISDPETDKDYKRND